MRIEIGSNASFWSAQQRNDLIYDCIDMIRARIPPSAPMRPAKPSFWELSCPRLARYSTALTLKPGGPAGRNTQPPGVRCNVATQYSVSGPRAVSGTFRSSSSIVQSLT